MFTPEFLAMVTSYTLPVLAVVELAKRLLNVKGVLVVVISAVVSFVVCIPAVGSGGLINYAVLAVCVALSANGVFKALKTG